MNTDPDIARRIIKAFLFEHPELVGDDEALRLSLESETDTIDKLRQIERNRRKAEADAKALKQVIDEWRERKDHHDWREERWREAAFKIMQETGLKSLPMPEATYSIHPGPSHVIITDEALIPDILCRFKREVDKLIIKELIKGGTPVQGAELSNAEPVLSIRTK